MWYTFAMLGNLNNPWGNCSLANCTTQSPNPYEPCRSLLILNPLSQKSHSKALKTIDFINIQWHTFPLCEKAIKTRVALTFARLHFHMILHSRNPSTYGVLCSSPSPFLRKHHKPPIKPVEFQPFTMCAKCRIKPYENNHFMTVWERKELMAT